MNKELQARLNALQKNTKRVAQKECEVTPYRGLDNDYMWWPDHRTQEKYAYPSRRGMSD